MKGRNETQLPCMLLTTWVEDDLMAASMIARATFDIVGHELVLANEQRWRVAVQPWDSPLGTFMGDQPHPKDGCDLFVAGPARAPKGEPVKELPLSLTVGDLRVEAVAIGPRVWQRRVGGGIVPSAPRPFTVLPVGLDRAYGGTVETEDEERRGLPLNPGGVGFQVDAAAALDKPLPFIEDPKHRIGSLDDRPTPVGFGLCQYPHPLRMLEAVTLDGLPPLAYGATRERGRPRKPPTVAFTPRVFNRAFPALVKPRVAPGEPVLVEGFSAEGDIVFAVPEIPVMVDVEVGGRRTRHVPQIDELGVDAANDQVFICYRHAFRYEMIKHDKRSCALLPAPSLGAAKD